MRLRLLSLGLLIAVILGCLPGLRGAHEPAHWLFGMSWGLLLAVVHVPETGGEFSLSWRSRWLVSCFFAAVTAAAAGCPFYLAMPMNGAFLMPFVLPGVGAIWIMCLLKKHPPCVYAHDAKWCIFSIWLSLMMAQLQWVTEALDWRTSSCMARACSVSIYNVVLCWMLVMFQSRLGMLGLGRASRSRIWVYVFFAALLGLNISHVIRYHGFGRGDTDTTFSVPSSVVLSAILLTIWVAYSIIVSVALHRGMTLLWWEGLKVRGLLQRQARWAARVLQIELLTCVTVATAAAVPMIQIHAFNLAVMLYPEKYESIPLLWWRWLAASRRMDCFINALAVAILSGILWQGNPPEECCDAEFDSKSRLRGMASMSDLLDDSLRHVYDAKVGDLARRGVRLASLLDFWASALELVDAASTTNDVVRQVIIPRSCLPDGGRALATLWEQDVVPQSMVTHHWNNRFVNLLGAMVADALHLDHYAEISDTLTTTQGVELLRRRCHSVLDKTFWVCAFSVNQHASICNGFGTEPAPATAEWHAWDAKRYNSITGESYPVCGCNEPKVLSNKEPTCELNKFDDMMAFLARSVPNFGQLIVVDKRFDVLYRAWCVAEVVEANVLGIKARIQVHSQNAVDCNYDHLAHLDVRNCSATSQADKDLILRKIYDIDAFNLKLQQLVFSSEGLFSGWVDGRERSRQVGRIWRRSLCRLEGLKDSSSCCLVPAALDSDDGELDSSSESPASTASEQ